MNNIKDCRGHEIITTGKRLDMRQNRHYTTSGYVWGWIDSGPNRYYWSNEPHSSFTEEQARKFCKEYNELVTL